jgi:hypothetical protein
MRILVRTFLTRVENFPYSGQGDALRAPQAGLACRSAHGGPAPTLPNFLPRRSTIWCCGGRVCFQASISWPTIGRLGWDG